MPIVTQDTLLVDSSGNPIVDGSGNPIIILAGHDTADCSCCGTNITVIQAYPCSIGSAGFWAYRPGNPNTLPTVGQVWRIDGDCWTINSFGSAPDTGQQEWDPIAGPFEECDTCCYTTAYARLTRCGGIQQIDFFYTPDPEDPQPCFDHHFTTGVYLYEGQCATLSNITAAQAVDPIEWPFPPFYGSCEQCEGSMSKCIYAEGCVNSQPYMYSWNPSLGTTLPSVGQVFRVPVAGGPQPSICIQITNVIDGECPGTPDGQWNPVNGPFIDCNTCTNQTACVITQQCQFGATLIFYYDPNDGFPLPSVGQVYKVNYDAQTRCVEVTEIDNESCTPGDHHWLVASGPFDTCESCAAPTQYCLTINVPDFAMTTTLTWDGVTPPVLPSVGQWYYWNGGGMVFGCAQILSVDQGPCETSNGDFYPGGPYPDSTCTNDIYYNYTGEEWQYSMIFDPPCHVGSSFGVISAAPLTVGSFYLRDSDPSNPIRIKILSFDGMTSVPPADTYTQDVSPCP